jgi:hypothetical protein
MCEMCGTPSRKGIILCPNCRFIFDEEKYAKLKARIAS